MVIAALFLLGLNSVRAQEDMFAESLAYKGHRVSDFTSLRARRARKLIDPSPVGMTTPRSCGTAVSVPRHAPLGMRSISDALASSPVDDTAPVVSNKHKLIHVENAYARLGKEEKTNPYCVYPFCMQEAGNHRSVCGEGSSRTQAGRSKTAFGCPGPGCASAYHPVCYMLRHALQTERELRTCAPRSP